MKTSEKTKDTRDDTLKIVAVIAMVVDHIGLIFFPQEPFLRVIGRLAFPIFAYYLTLGYAHTTDLKKYLLRLFVFAVASQIPYFLFTGDTKLNIFFTLFAGLLAIHGYASKNFPLTIIVLLLSAVIPMDYSYYGILLILSFFIFRQKWPLLFSQILINILGFFSFGALQPYSLAGTLLILLYPRSYLPIRVNKYFFYLFYPLHLAALYGLSQLPFFAK